MKKYKIEPFANLRRANLRGADLCVADLCGADLCGADLCGADLCGADLREADLRRADLRRANLRRADLRGANLCGADLREADLDFSALPLWCGSFDIIVDDKFVSQLLYHFAKLNTSKCSSEIQNQFSHIITNNKNLINKFCDYRNKIERIK